MSIDVIRNTILHKSILVQFSEIDAIYVLQIWIPKHHMKNIKRHHINHNLINEVLCYYKHQLALSSQLHLSSMIQPNQRRGMRLSKNIQLKHINPSFYNNISLRSKVKYNNNSGLLDLDLDIKQLYFLLFFNCTILFLHNSTSDICFSLFHHSSLLAILLLFFGYPPF